MADLPPKPSFQDGLALDVLERVLIELLQSRGISAGSLYSEALTLEELAARDGGLPLFVAQAAIWSQIMGIPHVVAPFDLAKDEATLVGTRTVLCGSVESCEFRVSAPMLLFIDHAVHVAHEGSPGQRLALETLIQPPQSAISKALSARSGPAPRAG